MNNSRIEITLSGEDSVSIEIPVTPEERTFLLNLMGRLNSAKEEQGAKYAPSIYIEDL